MKKFDREVRKMAKNTKYPISKEYETKVEQLLKDIQKEERKPVRGFSFSKAGFAACALCTIMVVSASVYAKENFVMGRMSEMSTEETQKYEALTDDSNIIHNGVTEALSFSREMTEEETERYDALWEQYREQGVFPDGELEAVDKLGEEEEVSSMVYETWNRKIYLPQRALTDEELLQIIDFRVKSEYVVSNSDEAKEDIRKQREFNADPTSKETDLSEEEAMEKASDYLEKMYDVDASAMDKTIEFVQGDGSDGTYGEWETFFQGKEGSYVVHVGRETGNLTEVRLHSEDGFYSSYTNPANSVIDEEFCRLVYKRAEAVIARMYPDTKVVNSSAGYWIEDNGTTSNWVNFAFYLDNGHSASLQYLIPEDVFEYLKMFPMDITNAGASDNYIIIPMK